MALRHLFLEHCRLTMLHFLLAGWVCPYVFESLSIDNALFSAGGVGCPNGLSQCQLTMHCFLLAAWSVMPAAYRVGPFRGMIWLTMHCFLLAAWSVIPAAYRVRPFRGVVRPADPCFLLAGYAFIRTAGRLVRKEQAVGGWRGCFWRVVGVKCFQDKTHVAVLRHYTSFMAKGRNWRYGSGQRLGDCIHEAE